MGEGAVDAAAASRDQAIFDWATEVMFEVRKQRSEAKQPAKVPVTLVRIRAAGEKVALMPFVEADLKAALRVQAFEAEVGEPQEIRVVGFEAPPA